MKWVDLIQFLIQYVFLLLSASVHESAHAWSAYKFGDPTAKLQNRISLNPANHIDILGTVIVPFLAFFSGGYLIGWARPTPVIPANLSNPRRDNMLVAAAGPFSNILSVLLLAILWHAAWSFTNKDRFMQPGEGIPILFCYVFGIGILLNLMLAVFNMLPIPPLDGSGVLEYLLPKELLPHYAKIRPYGFVILLLLFYFAGFGRWMGYIIGYLASLLGLVWIPLEEIW
jgi:Zn-dependent protease